MSNHQARILVTGASGHLGGLVLIHLIETFGYPPSQIIATSREPQSLAHWSERGIEVRKSDFSEPSSLAESFKGAEKLLLISTSSYDSEVRIQQHTQAINAAKQAGVGHIFYTSMPEPRCRWLASPRSHLGTEESDSSQRIEMDHPSQQLVFREPSNGPFPAHWRAAACTPPPEMAVLLTCRAAISPRRLLPHLSLMLASRIRLSL